MLLPIACGALALIARAEEPAGIAELQDPNRVLVCPEALLRGCCDGYCSKDPALHSLLPTWLRLRRLLQQTVALHPLLSRKLRGLLLLPEAMPRPVPAAGRRLLYVCRTERPMCRHRLFLASLRQDLWQSPLTHPANSHGMRP